MVTQRQQPSSSGWLVTDFVRRVAGAEHAVLVSANGLLLAGSRGMPRDRAEQLAAVASGLASMTSGAAHCFDAGEVAQTIVEMERGYLLLTAVPDGSALAVLAATDCELGTVAYEMTLLVDQVAADPRYTATPPEDALLKFQRGS